MRDRFSHPALQLLMFSRWDTACGWLLGKSTDLAPRWRLDDVMSNFGDRKAVRETILALIEILYAGFTVETSQLALAWSMLTVDPSKPESFSSVLPALQHALDTSDLDKPADAELRERIRSWWRGGKGEWTESEVSIFRIADVETQHDGDVSDPPDPEPKLQEMATSTSATLFADLGLPTLVVMPKDKSSKLNSFHAQYKDLVDASLPLVVARDVQGIRLSLHREFPHATVAVDLMLRDLREGRPVTLKPVLLVGSPGCGKSRLVRRLANMLGAFVYRYDAASSADSQFGGTGKAWSNTEPSVPARAVAQSKTASPIVLVDEIDKAAERNWNGRLWDAILPFLDVETACRYRDQSLDAEIDVSAISYLFTANDASKLPAPLKDRLRIIRVPSPTLAHLAPLAAQVMRDLAIEDEARAHDPPLASDELNVIGKAWARAGFSMRKLQKIILATLEARDSYAARH
jgi:ATP-dependent Lon protease